MNATEKMAIADAALRNPIEFNRNNIVDEAKALNHKTKIFFEVFVSSKLFVDEPGVDCGAMRSYLWNLLEKFKFF